MTEVNPVVTEWIINIHTIGELLNFNGDQILGRYFL